MKKSAVAGAGAARDRGADGAPFPERAASPRARAASTERGWHAGAGSSHRHPEPGQFTRALGRNARRSEAAPQARADLIACGGWYYAGPS
jgi:hypothetical protein